MDKSYSAVILNLINAYSHRISNYVLTLNKVSSLNEGIHKDEVNKKNSLVDKLNEEININIEIMNLLKALFTKENDAVTINEDMVKDLNERLKLTIEGLTSTVEGLNPTVEGLTSTVEGLKPSVEGLKPSVEGLKPSVEGLKPSVEGLNSTTEGFKKNIEVLKEITEILYNSNNISVLISDESEENKAKLLKPVLTPEQIKMKIVQSEGILREPFIEHFCRKFKFDKIPVRLAYIMEDVYKNSTTTQRHIKSVLRSSYTTTERAFSVLRKNGWIKLKSSRKNEKYILTPEGIAFIENIINQL